MAPVPPVIPPPVSIIPPPLGPDLGGPVAGLGSRVGLVVGVGGLVVPSGTGARVSY